MWADFLAAGGGAYNLSSTPNSALKVSAVYACNDRISKDVASLPFRPIRKIDNGQEIAKDYDQYRLTKYPSDFYTWYNYSYALNSHVNLQGNAYSPITRFKGRPVSYGIWQPQDVIHVINDNRLYWVNEKTKEVKSDADMIHLMWYTEDGIIGKSVLKFACDIIESAKNAGKLTSELSKNQMWSPGYLSFKEKMTPAQVEFIGKVWSKNYSGEVNASKTPVLDQGGEFKQFGMTMHDAQMIQEKEFSVSDICRFFGVPPSKVGIRDGNVSYNSLDAENTAYAQDTIVPRCISWEQEWDRKVVAEEDDEDIRFKHELKGRLRGDINARAALYNVMLNHGTFSRDEIRELEDMNTMGGAAGDLLVPLNYTPIEKLGQQQQDPSKVDFTPSKNGKSHADKVH